MIHQLEQVNEAESDASSTLKAKAKGILKSAKNLTLIKYGFFMKTSLIPTLSKLTKVFKNWLSLSLASMISLSLLLHFTVNTHIYRAPKLFEKDLSFFLLFTFIS